MIGKNVNGGRGGRDGESGNTVLCDIEQCRYLRGQSLQGAQLSWAETTAG